MTELEQSNFIQIKKETEIAAPPQIVWDAMLLEIGPATVKLDGTPMPLTLEPWPGGRYYRDLGNNTGHLWAHVQVIKPPTLLELHGPLMMSAAAISHVAYRLTPEGRGTRLTLTHRAMGEISQELRDGMPKGWQHFLDRIRARAQR
jgi:uncharacterized protein YndB with AHSA1/START domain